MGKVSIFKCTGVLAVASLASFSLSDFSADQLIQPKVRKYMEQAESSLHQGNFSEAIAVTDLILLSKNLRVRIDLDGVSPDKQAEYESAVKDGINAWAEAIEEDTNIKYVKSGNAEVRISFKPTVYYLGQNVGGVAVWSRKLYDWGNNNFSSRVTSDIRLSLNDAKGTSLPFDAIRHTSAHEFGHVIGLWDSPRIGDVMGPLRPNNPSLKPSEFELNALKEMRNRARVVAQTSLFAMKQFRP